RRDLVPPRRPSDRLAPASGEPVAPDLSTPPARGASRLVPRRQQPNPRSRFATGCGTGTAAGGRAAALTPLPRPRTVRKPTETDYPANAAAVDRQANLVGRALTPFERAHVP